MPLSIIEELQKSNMIPDISNPEVQSYLIKYVIALVGLALSGTVIYNAAIDHKSKTTSFYAYLIMVMLPIIVGVFLVAPVFNRPLDTNGMIFYGVIVSIILIAVYLFYRSMNPVSVSIATYGLSIVGVLIFIIGLALVYRIFVRSILNMRGWTGFIFKVLFFIPCLLIDLLETLFAELKNSPKMVVVLFVLEIVAILAYLYLPKLIRVTIPSNSKTLLNKPVFLTQSTTISRATGLVMPNTDVNNPGREEEKFRTNFALSMWVYVNQQSTSYSAYSKETDIFRYGDSGLATQGHPRITYFNDVKNGKPDQCIIYVSNKTDSNGVVPSMTTQLTAQAWNHLVINYNESDVDLFLNGNLVQSITLDSSAYPSFDMTDVVQVGSGDNTAIHGGLQGAICNVKYHYRSLLPIEVAGAYNLKRYTNPPIHSSSD